MRVVELHKRKKLKMTHHLSCVLDSTHNIIGNDELGEFSKLPKELVVEILYKLPVTSLGIVRCVSKTFDSMIQNPEFVETYRSKAPLRWLVFDHSELITFTIYVDNSRPSKRQALTLSVHLWSVNFYDGLLVFFNDDGKPLLHNISTQVTVELPSTHPASFTDTECLQIGLDISSNKYKVLYWKESRDLCLSFCYVLTLEKGSAWRPVGDTPQVRGVGKKPQTCANGSLFWLDDCQQRVILFDLSSEMFRSINPPCVMNLHESSYSLFEFNGSLCLVQKPRKEMFHLECMWLLKDVSREKWGLMLKNTVIPVGDTDCYSRSSLGNSLEFSDRYCEILMAAAVGKVQHIFLYNLLDRAYQHFKINELRGIRRGETYEQNDLQIAEYGTLVDASGSVEYGR
ncbi:hypothetical protein AQUCO_01700190v1 [Aquilegia coerulea]|uniref:F-box domain-containing protein n=1 Tax=Aquilegia coerulea TaxID=218851 RepID=A0A2G5DLN4_AQUCA|nr:hypothetical protein AQUCO_01700190v1 [Aquilegia coerulea]